MLDVHAVNGTPGAATVLGNAFATIPSNDGQQVAGVPIGVDATLVAWGGLTIAANTIASIKLQSQDQVDPINGELYTPGAASLLNIILAWDRLKYKTGLRAIHMGSNTGVDAASGYYLDMYSGGKCIADADGAIVVTGAHTFGGALTAGAWGSLAYAPANALPNGQYAILGAYCSAMSYGGLIRFGHADFGAYKPGFPVSNYEIVSTSSWDKIDKDSLLLTEVGYQFVSLSKSLKVPLCPVFHVTNAGTGLNIEMFSRVADTPAVNLVLAQVKRG